jgi:GMP synthase-like glutamine amidotransferase
MKIAAFQHTPGEPLGFFGSFLAARDIPFEYIRLYESNEITETDATHFIFLGGPMSVNDEEEYPYLKKEKEFIRRAVKRKDRILGICLGAQLIASAFGARVSTSVRETGWSKIQCEPVREGIFSAFPDRFFAFQLHGETFEIPRGGRLLCTGERVKNQAFLYRSALGLQFHLELTEVILREWSRELGRSQRDKILRETPQYLTESNRLCSLVAEDFTRY